MTAHAYQRVADALRGEIHGGRLRPGDKLPSESELMTTHGVSRIVIRQALGMLRNEGLILSRQGKGWFVSSTLGADTVKREHVSRGLELAEVVDQIDAQIATITRETEARTRGAGFEPSTREVYELRDTSGRYIMADLLTAKANALAALAHLENT